jgi:HlyD family secretion protein
VDARVVVDEQPDAVRVPLGALFRHGDGWAVYRVVDGHAVLAALATGIADDNHRVATQGVAAGDTVVMFPGNAVTDGQAVVRRKNN